MYRTYADDTSMPAWRTHPTVADRLPDLTDEQRAEAQEPEHVEWAQGALERKGRAELYIMHEYGITLQIVSDDIIRCVSVHDDHYCLFVLSMLICAFEHAGMTVQMDPYTLVGPSGGRQ